jgi:hypothetical protein
VAGVGQPDVEPLSAGTTAQPLVSPMQPVVTQDAVQNLVDAFHKGVISSADITDRIGAVAQAKKKAQLEELSEYVSPEAIQSRMDQYRAQSAQSQLAGAQATAGQPLVGPKTKKELDDITYAQATRLTGPAVQAYLQYNPPIQKIDANGNPTSEYDYDAMGREGTRYVRMNNMLQYSALGLAGKPIETFDKDTGQKKTVWLNAFGEDVTPDPQNKKVQDYQKIRQDAFKLFFKEPDTSPHFDPTVEGAGVAPAGAIQDNPPAPAILAPGLKPGEQPAVAPAAPAAAPAQPVVIPATTESPSGETAASVPPSNASGGYQPYQGFAMSPPPGVFQKDEIINNLKNDEVYKNWQATKGQVGNYLGAVNALNSLKPGDNHNVADVALAESLIKLADPQGTIREFKWDKFEHNQPLLDKLKTYQNWALGEGSFTDQTRKDLIALGRNYIKEREGTVKDAIQLAAKQTGTNKALSLGDILKQSDLDLLQGKSLLDAAPQSAQALQSFQNGTAKPSVGTAPPGSRTVTVKDSTGQSRTGYLMPDGNFQVLQ